MTEIHWMAATGLMTGLFWVVYVLNRISVIGIPATFANPSEEHTPLAAWAQRAKAAHSNAVENFVLFSSLVLGVSVLGLSSNLTASMAVLYFFARLAHFAVYTMGIPVLRTIAFAAGWIAQVALALVIFGIL